MNRKDIVLMPTWYRARNLRKAEAMETIGDRSAAERYRGMADWFREAIKRENELIEKGG